MRERFKHKEDNEDWKKERSVWSMMLYHEDEEVCESVRQSRSFKTAGCNFLIGAQSGNYTI